jgi:Na+-driven multidrug efflux pump
MLIFRAALLTMQTILARSGTAQVTCYHIEMTVWGIIAMPITGLQSATVTLIGNAAGEGSRERCHCAARYILRVALIGSAALSLPFFLCPDFLTSLCTSDPSMIRLCRMGMILSGVQILAYSVNDSYAMMFRAVGRADIPMYAGIPSTWLFRVFGMALAVSRGGGSVSAVLMNSADMLARTLAYALSERRGKWLLSVRGAQAGAAENPVPVKN